MALACFLPFLGPANLAADPRLGRPLPVSQRLVSLREALGAAAKATGVPLYPAPALAGRKMCLIADGPSAARILGRVADVLCAEWQVEGKGYRLAQTPKRAAEERAYAEARVRGRRALFERRLRDVMEATGETLEALEERQRDLYGQLDRLNRNGQPPSAAYLKVNAEAARIGQATDPSNYALGMIARGFSKDDWEAFWRGALVVVDSGEGRLRAPKGRRGYGQTVFLKYDPATARVSFRSVERNAEGQPIGGSSGQALPGEGERPEAAKPYFDEWEAWRKIPEDMPDVRIDDVPPPARWTWSGWRTLSDEMEWLARATKRPVVAEVDRQPIVPDRNLGPSNLKAWWRQVNAAGGGLHFEDGFIEARPSPYARVAEPDEEAIRALEAKAAPTYDDYAVFAAAVPQGVEVPETSVSPGPFSAMPALRFLGRLSASERKAALEGRPVAFARLSGPARAAFVEALDEAVFRSVALGERLARALVRREPAGEGLAFFVAPLTQPGVRRQKWNRDPLATPEYEPEPPLYRMTFGYADGEGATFHVDRTIPTKRPGGA